MAHATAKRDQRSRKCANQDAAPPGGWDEGTIGGKDGWHRRLGHTQYAATTVHSAFACTGVHTSGAAELERCSLLLALRWVDVDWAHCCKAAQHKVC